ncbi:hypothetical protein ABIC17_001851 [Sphingomonas sp. PvP056]
MRFSIGCAVALCAAGSASAQSGPVTMWFYETPATVSDKLALLCSDRSASVVEQDERHLLCQRPVTGGKGILAQAVLGNSYSTSPQLMIRFAILKDRSASRVQASQWIEVQMASGQVRRTELNDRKQREELGNVLAAAGAHDLPPDMPAVTPPQGNSSSSPTP